MVGHQELAGHEGLVAEDKAHGPPFRRGEDGAGLRVGEADVVGPVVAGTGADRQAAGDERGRLGLEAVAARGRRVRNAGSCVRETRAKM